MAVGRLFFLSFSLGEGVNCNSQDGIDKRFLANFGLTPDYDEIEVVNLLRGRANIDYQDEFGESAILKAVDSYNLPAVKLLLENKADANILDYTGTSAVLLAAQHFQLGDMGIAPNTREIWRLLKPYAMRQEDGFGIRHMRQLYEHQNMRAGFSKFWDRSPLCVQNEGQLVQRLLQAKADVNGISPTDLAQRTPLLHLIGEKKMTVDILKVLLENRADVDHIDSSGQSALDVAVKELNYYFYSHTQPTPSDVITLLLQAGCKIGFEGPGHKHHLIDRSIWLLLSALKGNVCCIKESLNGGAVAQARWKEDGNNALGIAILSECIGGVEVLWKIFARECKWVMMMKQVCRCVFKYLPFDRDVFLLLIKMLIGNNGWLVPNNQGKTFFDLGEGSDDPSIRLFFKDPFQLMGLKGE